MRILTPEDLAQKYQIKGDPQKLVRSPGQADFAPPVSTTAIPMSQREYESFSKRGIRVDPDNFGDSHALRYHDQSSLERAGNAFVRGSIGAFGVMLEDASYMTLQPFGEASGILDKWEQNIVADWGNKIKEYGHEAFPHYTEKPGQISWSPWAILGDLIENGLGFAVPGVGVAKGVAALTKLGRASKIKKYADVLKPAFGAKGSLEKTANFVLPGLISNHAEGTMMGFETYKDLLAQGYSEEEAGRAADEVVFHNKALMVTDMLQLHGIYKGTKAMRNTMRNPAKWKQNLKSAFTTMNAENPVFQSLIESGEEILQGIFQREAENKITVEGKELRSEKDLMGRIREYLKEESIWYEGALGFLSGGAQQVLMKEMGNAMDRRSYNKLQSQATKLDTEILAATDPIQKHSLMKQKEDLENEMARTTQQGMYESQQKLIKNTEEHIKHRYKSEIELDILAKEALQKGDFEAFEMIQSSKFSTVAFDNMARGTLDTLERSLQDMLSEQLSPEEIKDRGYSENYKEKIQSDIKLLKVLENDFIESGNYVNHSEVYHQKQVLRNTRNQLNGVLDHLDDVINGTKGEKGKVITHGLEATAERIASETNASEFKFNKFMTGGLKLGDIEDESERNKLRTALEKITNSFEYKEFKKADLIRIKAREKLELEQKNLEDMISPDTQEKIRKQIQERKKSAEQIKKAIEIKKKKVETVSNKNTEENTEEKVETKVETKIEEEVEENTEEKVETKVETKIVEINPLDHFKNEEDTVLTQSEIDELKNKFDQKESDRVKAEQGGLSPKVTSNQRAFKYDNGVIVDTEDDYRKDSEGNYIEEIANALDPEVTTGTELMFVIEYDVPINKDQTYREYEEANKGEVNMDLIPIRIYAKKGNEYKSIGFVASGKKSDPSLRQLRESIYSAFLNGETVSGEITYKYDGVLFKLKNNGVMNSQEAFPETNDLAVVRKNGTVEYTGKQTSIDEEFKNPGFTFIVLKDGRFIATYPNKIDEGHVNIMSDAIEIFVLLNHPSNANKNLEEILSPLLLNSFSTLTESGHIVNTKEGLEAFLSLYGMPLNLDVRYDLTKEDRGLGYTSPLAKYVITHASNPESRLAKKPLFQIQANGVAFILNSDKTKLGSIGYSIGGNTPLNILSDPLWREELKKVLSNTYRNTDINSLNKEVVDIQRIGTEITTNKILYNILVKTGSSTTHKSVNIGTEENPNRVHTVNPVIRYKIKTKESSNINLPATGTITSVNKVGNNKSDMARRKKEEVNPTEILEKVLKEELTVLEAMDILEDNDLEKTEEYDAIYNIYKANDEGSSDSIILPNIPKGSMALINKVQAKLRGILLTKDIIDSRNRVKNNTDFQNEVSKFTYQLGKEVKELLSLPKEFNLYRIAQDINGTMVWNMNSLAFYDFANKKFTETNMKILSFPVVRSITEMLNGEKISDFLHLSKIHSINCK